MCTVMQLPCKWFHYVQVSTNAPNRYNCIFEFWPIQENASLSNTAFWREKKKTSEYEKECFLLFPNLPKRESGILTSLFYICTLFFLQGTQISLSNASFPFCIQPVFRVGVCCLQSPLLCGVVCTSGFPHS